MSYVISKEIQFDAGHRVPLHESKCKNPHGHRYTVVAQLDGELITDGPESGMVRDFSIVKKLLTEKVHDPFDHGFIVHSADHTMLRALGHENDDGSPIRGDESRYGWKVIVVDFVPTAECLARHFYDVLVKEIPNLTQIDVWETPTSCASYIGG